MIHIDGKPADAELLKELSKDSLEKDIINILANSQKIYTYSINELKFELILRKEIIEAAHDLNRSGISFRVFRDSKCNREYWDRMDDGGFAVKSDVSPGEAISDIYKNGSRYGTECATAIVIIYYKALLEVFGKERFDQLFPNIYLMNWHLIDNKLKEVGLTHKETDYLPGDRRYFINPDVDPITPQWQGENVIDMNHGLYYGHGVGIRNAEAMIKILNTKRKKDAVESAYLLDSVGRPNFRNLADIYYREH
ncbi:MAG: protein-glutamine gamma-glutamyltransferase [Clostridiales bacterium]|nr:protein-glutamine gamma-glutamyltransferase [Clostridiales bacterium]